MQLFYEMFISMGRQLDLIQKAQYTLCRVCNIFLYDRPMFHQPVPHLFEGNYTSDIIKSVFEKNDPSLDAILADARDPGVVPYLAKCFLDNPPIADVGRTSGYMKIVQRNLCIIRLLREIGTRDAAKALDTFCNETTYAFGSVFPTMAAKMLKELPVR